MKKALLLTGVLLAMTTSLASAQGLNMGWSVIGGASACPTNAASLADMSDPCDDSGFEYLVGSVVAPAGLTQVTGEEAYVDMQVAAGAIPDFWHMENPNAGQCANGKLLMEAVFTGFTTSTLATGCSNYWGTSASGGFNWAPGVGGPNRVRMSGVFARTPSSATLMVAGRQYYVWRASITADHATTCVGCAIPACWVFNRLLLTQPVGHPNGNADITAQAQRRFTTWQGGAGTDCPNATPTQRATWGQVKSLYR